MKKKSLFLAVALGAALFAVSAHADIQGFGTVVKVTGQATYSLGDGNWHPLESGQRLPVGSVIKTTGNGIVDVVLGKEIAAVATIRSQPGPIGLAPDSPVRGMINYKPTKQQNVVRLTPNTTLAIDKLKIIDTGLDEVSDTELNLTEGAVYASVKKLSGGSQYLIKIPNGIAGVRGTELYVSADGQTKVFSSEHGGVVVSLVKQDGTTATYLVTPGNQLDGNTGSTSSMPPSVQNDLHAIFSAVKTAFEQHISFAFDHTKGFVSPTQGSNGNGPVFN